MRLFGLYSLDVVCFYFARTISLSFHLGLLFSCVLCVSLTHFLNNVIQRGANTSGSRNCKHFSHAAIYIFTLNHFCMGNPLMVFVATREFIRSETFCVCVCVEDSEAKQFYCLFPNLSSRKIHTLDIVHSRGFGVLMPWHNNAFGSLYFTLLCMQYEKLYPQTCSFYALILLGICCRMLFSFYFIYMQLMLCTHISASDCLWRHRRRKQQHHKLQR